MYKKELPRNAQPFSKNLESYKDRYQQLAKAHYVNFTITPLESILATSQYKEVKKKNLELNPKTFLASQGGYYPKNSCKSIDHLSAT